MALLVLVVATTLTVSFFCSLFEAIIFSTTTAEIEALKKSRPRRGQRLEQMKHEIDETISAILTLNTVANSLGAVLIGAIGARVLNDRMLAVFSVGFGAALLVLAEVLPKSLGVVHRRALQPFAVYPVWWMRRVLLPVTWVCNFFVRLLVKESSHTHRSDEEIILLAERGAKQGTLSKSESSIIANALSLDEIRVAEIMTPRTVVTALRKSTSIGDVFREYPNLPFGRMPVYGKNLDDIAGLARRRDLLKAKANDQDTEPVEKFIHEVQFVPETATVADAMQVCLRTHQQLLVVVDEFGSTAGVVTMEDIIEQLLGREIFEKDDMAVDMRELARTRQQKEPRGKRAADSSAAPAPKKSS